MQRSKLFHFAQCESDFFAPLDELQALHVACAVHPVAGRRARRFSQQSAPLIKANRLEINSRSLRQFPNAHAKDSKPYTAL